MRPLPPAPYAILDFDATSGPRTRPLLFRPREVVTAERLGDVLPVIAAVERATAGGAHAVGFLSYEAAPAFDAALAVRERGPLPLAWFLLCDAPEPLDALPPHGEASIGAWTCDVTPAEHARAVREIRERIAAGDVYQVNHTARLRAAFAGDPLALFARLRRAQPGGWAAFLDLGRHAVVSASPELFVARRGDRVTTRPMKGTAARGRWPGEDAAQAAALAASEKERAENVMIVDLLRNDLGRVAEPGSVRVPRLFEVERWPTVWQMTSTIEATLREDARTLTALCSALFPCGSVTGAPKVAASRIIAELERAPRGAYCGAIGHVAPGGDAAFNVAIRTAWVDRLAGTVEYGSGGGITWDSEPAGEHRELLTKAAILTVERPSFALLETLRLEDGAYPRRARHLARLAASAEYFGRPLDRTAVERALDDAARSAPHGAHRVRLLVDGAGAARTERTALAVDDAPDEPRPVALAAGPVDSADVFLYHKTTHRATYDRHRAAHPDAFDVLLWNERGELTEFTIGNVVVQLDGVRVTPPVSCGLLGGVFRAELLERGEIVERVVRVSELAGAEGLWLVNGVRGWVPVRLAARPPQGSAAAPAAPQNPDGMTE